MPILLHLFYQHSCGNLWILGEPAHPSQCFWSTLPCEWVNTPSKLPFHLHRAPSPPQAASREPNQLLLLCKGWKGSHAGKAADIKPVLSIDFQLILNSNPVFQLIFLHNIPHIWFKPPFHTPSEAAWVLSCRKLIKCRVWQKGFPLFF